MAFCHLSMFEFAFTLMQARSALQKLSLFKKHIALPQDHGSWVFILSPLVIGIFSGAVFTSDTLLLVIAAMAAFLLRQPVAILVKVLSSRRPKADQVPALFWVGLYTFISLAALAGLLFESYFFLLYLAVPGILVFAWHLWLVSRRAERRQAGVEIIATGVLSLAAPAAYWVGLGDYEPQGWWLWLLVWLQSAASIVYAYLRLEQREMGKYNEEIVPLRGISLRSTSPGRANLAPTSRNGMLMGRRALLYTSFNVFFSLSVGMAGILPRFIFLSFLLQWLETIWGITHPAAGWKPARIGVRQLIVSTLWTILFVITWRL